MRAGREHRAGESPFSPVFSHPCRHQAWRVFLLGEFLMFAKFSLFQTYVWGQVKGPFPKHIAVAWQQL